ncbi:DSF2 [Fusarium phyllophilum]|uniref:DSF2 n=1 Tax=Fusarium phyllophilum TaxID=47803 RepID=A0A8H5MVQ4_9HYPO|nr:DSF2 [Fusarium phyllophilum]
MGIRDILKKKDDLSTGQPPEKGTIDHLAAPEFTIIRSDTSTQERIYPPSMKSVDNLHLAVQEPKEKDKSRRSLDVFRSGRSRSASESSQTKKESGARRLSQRLHLSRAPPSSENVPENLPDIVTSDEAQWEKRATMLAGQNNRARSSSRPGTPSDSSRSEERAVSSQQIDQDIQEAIRLHEEGKLELSTRMFGRLADPQGANNPLSQVLYGLALRHGWGCAPDPEGAVKYLSAAASNSASIEQMALQAGMKKGGAAKGELVLAIFELANCFRHGWGIEKDAYAAKQYYETAANLGDTDAMNEIAWCYVEGFGCKKDKFAAARYYRLAEKAGNKTLGNSWIWKEKYDPPGEGNRK